MLYTQHRRFFTGSINAKQLVPFQTTNKLFEKVPTVWVKYKYLLLFCCEQLNLAILAKPGLGLLGEFLNKL